MKELLLFSHINAECGARVPLRDFNFSVFEGEVIYLIGNERAGKSTVLELIEGKADITGGRVYYKECAVRDYNEYFAKEHGIFCINHKNMLFEDMSLWDNVFLSGKQTRLFSRKSADEQQLLSTFMELTGLDRPAHIPVKELSVYEKFLLSVIKALVHHGKILVIDIIRLPINYLELQRLEGLLRRLKQNGLTVILVHIRITELLFNVDRVLVMKNGTDMKLFSKNCFTREDILQCFIGDLSSLTKTPSMHPVDAKFIISDEYNKIFLRMNAGEILGVCDIAGNSHSDFGTKFPSIFETLKIRQDSCKMSMTLALPAAFNNVKGDQVFIPSDSASRLFYRMSLADNLSISKMPGLCVGTLNSARLSRALQMDFVQRFHLPENISDIKNLSKVTQKIISIFRWEILNPKCILLENPFFDLDDASTKILTDYLASLSAKGIMILILSDNLESLRSSCASILLLCEDQFKYVYHPGESDSNIVRWLEQ